MTKTKNPRKDAKGDLIIKKRGIVVLSPVSTLGQLSERLLYGNRRVQGSCQPGANHSHDIVEHQD
jgi:hypothetical protein